MGNWSPHVCFKVQFLGVQWFQRRYLKFGLCILFILKHIWVYSCWSGTCKIQGSIAQDVYSDSSKKTDILLYDTQNTFYLIVRGLTNAFLMPLRPLIHCYLTVLWQSSSGSEEELGILGVGWKWLFWCKIHFRKPVIMI